MKEMIYKERCYEILDQGEYKGRKYFIISYGTYPCAYIENKENYTCNDLKNLNVHGGISFEGSKENTNVIGWDYGHCCDFVSDAPNLGGKQWTTREIKEEVFSVIDQLENMKETNRVRLERK